MAVCTFTYTPTNPDTVVTFLHDPQVGDWSRSQKWASPMIKAAGGENSFVKDKSIVFYYHSLYWPDMYPADLTALLAFLVVVDGISNEFDYVDPLGVSWKARIWNSQEIRDSLVAHGRTDITIELIVTEPPA
jgi:hypothetical protein